MIRFLETRPLRKANTKNMKQIFYNDIIFRYSLSNIIIIDRRSEFKKELKEFYKAIEVARVMILAHNP